MWNDGVMDRILTGIGSKNQLFGIKEKIVHDPAVSKPRKTETYDSQHLSPSDMDRLDGHLLGCSGSFTLPGPIPGKIGRRPGRLVRADEHLHK